MITWGRILREGEPFNKDVRAGQPMKLGRVRKLLESRVGSEVHQGEVKELADDEEVHHSLWMLRLMGSEEEFQLLEQALAVALLEHGEEPLLERHAPALGADEEVLHQLVGVVCR